MGLIIEKEEGKYIFVSDKNGYKYRIVKYCFKKKPQTPHLYNKNPFAYHNLQTYLSIERPNIRLISKDYKTCKDQIEFVCEIHKDLGIQTTTLEHMYHQKDICYGCINKIRGMRYRVSTETIKERCDELHLEYVDRYNDDEKQSTVVKLICPKHRDKGIQTKYWETLRMASIGCPFCYGRYKTTEEVSKELNSINDTYDYLSEYKRFEDNAICRCKICGNIWETTIASLKHGSGCPRCAMSHGEKVVIGVLEKLDINYIPQHTFEDCVLVNKLKFDFYLPTYNTIIEYDGEQHYTPIDFANRGHDWAVEAFKRNKQRDAFKNEYCKTKGINLLRIPYWEYENTETIIIDFIKNIQESQETAG